MLDHDGGRLDPEATRAVSALAEQVPPGVGGYYAVREEGLDHFGPTLYEHYQSQGLRPGGVQIEQSLGADRTTSEITLRIFGLDAL